LRSFRRDLLQYLVCRRSEESTPKHHRSQLRLAAAKHLLKLCCNKALDKIFSPRDFNRLTKIVQDALPEVRAGFHRALKNHNGQNLLPRRFYSFMFLFAFEPKKSTKEATVTFLKARASTFAKSGDQFLEGVFSQFLSLLAHHQDFSPAPEDLTDMVDYIIFYLKIVATEANLPVIYSIAQRMKTVQDGIDPERSENLYVLSDLAEAIIRIYQEQRGWSLQIFSGKTHLPQGIFARMPNHAMAQEIAEKRFVPDELADELEDLVKDRMRTKKRKAEKTDAASNRAPKKARTSTASTTKSVRKAKAPKAPKAVKPAKTPKKSRADVVPSSDRRKSARGSNVRNYAELSDDEDEEEEEIEEEGEEDPDEEEEEQAHESAASEEVEVEEGGERDEEGNKENELTSTPPTSDPTPAPAPAVIRKEKQAAEKKKTSEKKATKQKKQQQPPAARAGRATRNTKKAADIYDMPGDSDDELSDAPDDMEV
jgi:sister-chromatid-cohesion protein PDS5